jgi:hypothetical protein
MLSLDADPLSRFEIQLDPKIQNMSVTYLKIGALLAEF